MCLFVTVDRHTGIQLSPQTATIVMCLQLRDSSTTGMTQWIDVPVRQMVEVAHHNPRTKESRPRIVVPYYGNHHHSKGSIDDRSSNGRFVRHGTHTRARAQSVLLLLGVTLLIL